MAVHVPENWPAVVEALAVVAAALLAGWTLVRDRQEKQARRRATDARLSALAYVLRRQLRSWLDEAPNELKAVVHAWQAYGGDLKLGDIQHILNEVLRWARGRPAQQFDRAEERMVELVAATPDASP